MEGFRRQSNLKVLFHYIRFDENKPSVNNLVRFIMASDVSKISGVFRDFRRNQFNNWLSWRKHRKN